MVNEKIYQSILNQLSHIPADYLQQVELFLNNLSKEIEKREKNRVETLKLVGTWNDMSQDDFDDYLSYAKKTGDALFQ